MRNIVAWVIAVASVLSHDAALAEELLGTVTKLEAGSVFIGIEGKQYRLSSNAYWYDTWDSEGRPVPLSRADLRLGDRVQFETDGTSVQSIQLMGRVDGNGVMRRIITPQ